MYVGLIVVINGFENEALKSNYILSIKQLQDVKVCLVCNTSDDRVFEVLSEIVHHCKNATLVNNKRIKSNTASVRAGARYLYSQYNLKYVGCIVGVKNGKSLEILKSYTDHRQSLLEFIQKEKLTKKVKQTYFQSLISIPESLERIDSEANLQLVDNKR